MKFAVFILLIMLAAAQAPADLLARFRTVAGDIVVQLYEYEKPVTVGNFVRLVESSAYWHNFFHRCIPGFVLQGGGFYTIDRTSTNLFTEPHLTPNYGPITNEYSVGRHYSNVYGTIAMAKTTNSPDTATSQFFFNLANNSTNLDNQNGGFTVFGRVVSGFEILDFFNSLSAGYGIVNIGGEFQTLPVNYPGMYYPRYVDLFYVDISLLRSSSISSTGSTHTITWEGATGLTNHLEACTNLLSESWTAVLTTNAGWAPITATVTNPPDSAMFYRIRVEVPPE
ncbi:MAG: peptidylprolyl isomerase [Kiritimatiellia bacterium]